MAAEWEKYKLEGNEKYKAKDYKGAIESYSQAILHDATNAALYTNRAAAYLMVLQYKQAADDCELAIRYDNTNSKAYFRRATALKGLGKLDEAIAAISSGLEIEPTNATALREKEALMGAKGQWEQVRLLISSKQWSKALLFLDPLIRELGSGSRELNIMKVECLVETRRFEEALNLSNAIMRTVPAGDVELLQVRAKCLYQMGDVENAYKHLQQAMRCDPDNAVVRAEFRRVKEMESAKDRGNSAFQEGRLEEALQEWQACIEVDPSNKLFVSKIHSNRASALVKLKRLEEAVSACSLALEANEHNVKARLRRADANYSLGGEERLAQALRDYETLQESREEGSPDMSSKIKQTKTAIQMAKRKDLYQILGVTRTADSNELKKAYRKSALMYHPDKQNGKTDKEKEDANAKFKDVGEAYEILSDPEKRALYDSGVEIEDIDNPHAGHGGHGHGGFHGMDPNMLFHMFMQQQNQGGGGGGMRFG